MLQHLDHHLNREKSPDFAHTLPFLSLSKKEKNLRNIDQNLYLDPIEITKVAIPYIVEGDLDEMRQRLCALLKKEENRNEEVIKNQKKKIRTKKK